MFLKSGGSDSLCVLDLQEGTEDNFSQAVLYTSEDGIDYTPTWLTKVY